MKRILSLILIILLVPTVSFAEETLSPIDDSSPMTLSLGEENLFEETMPEPRTGGVSYEFEKLQEMPEDALALPNFFAEVPFGERLMASMEAYIEETGKLPAAIDVEGEGITLENLDDTYYSYVLRNPQLLLHTAIRYYDPEGDGVIEAFAPVFMVNDVDEFYEARQAMYSGMQEYLALAAEYEDPVEKLLALHDKMVELCVYDSRVMSSDPAVQAQAPKTVYHALGVFRDKFAVCQGYSQAFYMLGKEIGIEIDLCESDEANHMWNYVKLDDKWYYMDMTNDDPDDAQGRAAHTFFLFSENKLIPIAHGTDYERVGGGISPVCNDTKYDTDHFFNLPIAFKGYREADGKYHARVDFKSNAGGFETVLEFRSDTLYTGPVLLAPIVVEGNYTTTENGQQVQKRAINLYMVEYPLRSVGATFPVIRFGNRYSPLPERASMNKNTVYMRLLLVDVEDIDLSLFTSYLFGINTLTPYSTKNNWK